MPRLLCYGLYVIGQDWSKASGRELRKKVSGERNANHLIIQLASGDSNFCLLSKDYFHQYQWLTGDTFTHSFNKP